MVQDLASLQRELASVRQELLVKTEECESLRTIRDNLEEETGDLTAQLFEEANKMVQTAMSGEHKAKKRAQEAFDEIDALKIEVEALKALSAKYINGDSPLTPTTGKKSNKYFSKLLGSPMRMQKRTNNNSLPDITSAQVSSAPVSPYHSTSINPEINHGLYDEFLTWYDAIDTAAFADIKCCCTSDGEKPTPLRNCCVMLDSPLLTRILREDALPCIDFSNKELSERLQLSMHLNLLTLEPLNSTTQQQQVKTKCALTHAMVCCKYKMRTDDSDCWLPISHAARQRITKVCDFLTFLRYIHKGIVSYSANRTYDELTRHRREMALARIGSTFSGI